MLDTVVMTLVPGEFTLLDYDVFTPSAKGLFVHPYYPVRGRGFSCVYNPDRIIKEKFGYMPRLTLSKRPAQRGFVIALRIEFSAPKMLYGNNFDELTQTDFPKLLQRLQEQLGHMKVRVTQAALKRSPISAIHYSKNLPLTDYTSCGMVIRELAKGSISRTLDSVKTDYYNDGSALRFHASNHEIIFYDKLKDLARGKKSDKRAVEKENAVQLDLLRGEFKKPFEVLRVEVRLGNRKKIKSLFASLKQEKELIFENLYSEELAKIILLHHWQKVTPDVPLVAASQFRPDELYDAIYKANPTLKPAKVLQLVGALAIVRHAGMEGLRVRVEQHSESRTWYGLKKYLHEQNLTSKLKYNALQIAEGHLWDFVPLRLKDYQL